MRLLRLHLQGFKSFKDKTTIHFDDGITGIVGPNGCGKSNIVDALFWVMGEQSAKHLRGSKMKDLIFSGSTKYSPASFAEVTLVLLNDTDKHIHIGNQVHKPKEIQLTRKLYKTGDTEYRINGIPARLKDIHEVFMDTGAGAKSYSIIAQGEINKLVQAKPIERRTMIEEVAGITKFKMRKKESLKKIEQTTLNLERLSDLQSEIYKNLKSLEKQAEKAERARTLKTKLTKHELIVDSHKEHDFISQYVQSNAILTNNEEAIEKIKLEKETVELNLEEERTQKVTLMEKIELSQSSYNEESKELAASEERLKHLKSSSTEKAQRIEEKKAENEELLKDISGRRERYNELEEQFKQLKTFNGESVDMEEIDSKLEIIKDSFNLKKEELTGYLEEINELETQANSSEQTLFKNNAKIEEISNALEDIVVEVEELEKQSSSVTDELVKHRRNKEEAYTLFISESERLESLEAESKEFNEKYSNKSSLLDEKQKSLFKAESKRDSLVAINNSGAVVKQNGLKFIESNEQYTLFEDVLSSEKDFARSSEVLLESYFNTLISVDDTPGELLNAAAADGLSYDYLSTKSVENFVSSESDIAERVTLRLSSEVKTLNDVVTITNKSYEGNLRKVFSGYYIVESFNPKEVEKLLDGIDFKGIVTQDGSKLVTKQNGLLKITLRAKEDLSIGIVERNNMINDLDSEISTLSSEVAELEEVVTELKEKKSDIQLSLEECRKNFAGINNNYISLKSSLDSREANFNTNGTRLELLLKRKADLSKEKLSLVEKDEDTKKESSVLKTELENKNLAFDEFKNMFEDIQSNYEIEREELLASQARYKTLDTQIQNMESQIEDATNQIERFEQKLEGNNTYSEKLELEIEETNNILGDLEISVQDQAEKLKDKEAVLNMIKDQLTDLLVGMQEREDQVKQMSAQMNKLEKETVEHNMKVEKIVEDEDILVRNIFDKYKVNLRNSLKSHLEVTSEKLEGLKDLEHIYEMETEEGVETIVEEEYSFDKRFPGQVKESKEKCKSYRTQLARLGEINWQAIKDYDRQKLRHNFLREQEGELKQSLEDLETAISHIDEKSKKRFQIAFEEVNSKFTKVFPIIFGGGSANLKIIGNLDDIDCGIDIIAQPPGKKMQSINLMSGGEKAMTAVSLIFSIFLVKPSPFCLLDEVDAPLDDANVGRFNELLREMSSDSQFILITHNKKTMELNDTLYGVTMQEPGVSKAVSVRLS